ncbi:MAG: DUF3576 domain-containing protein [Hyphomonadaceae bacterium]|nr:DUF3576 domain-containing protein [Hyphomonadaceae bacterium]
MIQRARFVLVAAAALVAAGALAGCGGNRNPEGESKSGFFGGKEKSAAEEGIGVNSFLWRASLDTLNFMPLASADPFGGVIITDWYMDPQRPGERYKATVYILDTRLRADALNVSIFREQQVAGGQWQQVNTSPDTAIQIENAILTRARQLRLSTLRDKDD